MKRTYEEKLSKLRSYCSYQDRSINEVKQKAILLGLKQGEIEAAIKQLIKDDFLNEKRFVRSFIRGKLNHKRWGKFKIISALKAKGILQAEIKLGLDEIDESEFQLNMERLVENYLDKMDSNLDNTQIALKAINYLKSKGYEEYMVYEMLMQKGLV